MRYFDFLRDIKEISTSHILVNEYSEGDIYEYLNAGEHKYPCVFLTVTNISTSLSSSSINFTLFYTDRLLENGSNKTAIQSTGIQVIRQILSRFEERNPEYQFNSVDYTPFTEKFSDMCAGVFGEISVDNLDSLENLECEDGEFELKEITLTENGVYDILGYDRAIVAVDSNCEEYEAMLEELNTAIGEKDDTIADLQKTIKNKNGYILDLQEVNAVLQQSFDDERVKSYQLQQKINSVSSLTITENGTYTPPTDVLGYDEIVVDVAGGTEDLPRLKVKSITVNSKCITNGRWEYDTLIDTTDMTSLESMFEMCEALKQIDVSNWNVKNVKSLKRLFCYCTNLQKFDGSTWNTRYVTTIEGLFQQCYNITEVNISNFNTSKVTNFMNLFGMCSKLTEVNISNFNTSNVTTIEGLFNGCYLLSKVDVSKWDTSSITNMQSAFTQCYALTELNLTNWDTSSVENINYMLYEVKLQQIDLTNFNAGNVTKCEKFSQRSSIINYVGGRTIDEVIENNICILNGLSVGSNTSIMSDYADRASIRALINGLADLTGSTSQTIYLGSTLLAKLTQEDIAIATAKNWTLS